MDINIHSQRSTRGRTLSYRISYHIIAQVPSCYRLRRDYRAGLFTSTAPQCCMYRTGPVLWPRRTSNFNFAAMLRCAPLRGISLC